jgi:hypothetical protein
MPIRRNGMNSKDDANAKKFSEPRSWAAKWCGHSLYQAEGPAETPPRNGRKFAEPKGWSVKWSGSGLFPDRKR